MEENHLTSLFSLLEDRDEETFSQRCANNRGRLDENNGEYTYLQLACLYGLPEAVEALLTNGADPNLTCHPDQCSPIMIAGQQGYLNIVEILAQHNGVTFNSTAKGTVLHAVLEGMSKNRGEIVDFGCMTAEKYVNCLKLLLEENSPNSLDINARNEDGFTALHLAIELNEKSIILLLLKHGAYIGVCCQGCYKAISMLNANELQEYLNNFIDTNGELPSDENYEIIYNYRFLDPLRIYRNNIEVGKIEHNILVSETEPLVKLSGVPQLRHLITHPVLTSFLEMKWLTVRGYFWANFIFYLTFWLFLTLHTLAVYSLFEITPGSHLDLPEQLKRFVAYWTWYLSIILCGILGLREYFKFTVSPTRYVFDMENLLYIAVLVSNLLILFLNVGAEFAAIALVLTWTGMILFINRHPSLAPYIVKFKIACPNFLKLLACSTVPMVASTMISQHFYKNKTTSFFKIIPMMTELFETISKPFDCCNLGISHVVFVVFVSLTAIVLLKFIIKDLPSGNTLAFEKNALIVGYANLAKQIASIETMVNHLKISDNFLCCVTLNMIEKKRLSASVFYKNVNLFPYVLPDSCLHILPNQGSRVNFSDHLDLQEVPWWKEKDFSSILSPLACVPDYGSLFEDMTLHAWESEEEED